jgi:uncharacterized membrane protein
MKQLRLENLSDGIFAIVLTLLAIDLKLPTFLSPLSEADLWNALVHLGPVFISFILSFALLFTYWRAHHFIISIYARDIDVRLTTINALFFFFIALIPFTTRLLGEFHGFKLSIIVYAVNIICIGFSLYWMRSYIFSSGNIDHKMIKISERRRGAIRILVPVVCACAAIIISFYRTDAAFSLLAFAIVFNLISRSTTFVNWIIERLFYSPND